MDIYMLKNFTLQEVYFGIADGETQATVNKHKNNPDSPVGHWKFGKEEIKWGIVEDGLSEMYANAFIQALRREPQDDGWVVVFGGE